MHARIVTFKIGQSAMQINVRENLTLRINVLENLTHAWFFCREIPMP